MKYCPYCDREVKGTKKFNWIAFLLWCLLCGVGGLVYIAYYVFKLNNKCPICGGKLKGKKPKEVI